MILASSVKTKEVEVIEFHRIDDTVLNSFDLTFSGGTNKSSLTISSYKAEMLSIYGHYDFLKSLSVWTVFRRQNLTSTDVRF